MPRKKKYVPVAYMITPEDKKYVKNLADTTADSNASMIIRELIELHRVNSKNKPKGTA